MTRNTAINTLSNKALQAVQSISALEDNLHAQIVSCGQENNEAIETADFSAQLLSQSQAEHSTLESHHNNLLEQQSTSGTTAAAIIDASSFLSLLQQVENGATTEFSSSCQEAQQELSQKAQTCSNSLDTEHRNLMVQLQQQGKDIEVQMDNVHSSTRQVLSKQASTEITKQSNEADNGEKQLQTAGGTAVQDLNNCAVMATKELHAEKEQFDDSLSAQAEQDKQGLEQTKNGLSNMLNQHGQKLESKINEHNEGLKGDIQAHGEVLIEKMSDENHTRKEKLTQDKEQCINQQESRNKELIDETLPQKREECRDKIDTAYNDGNGSIQAACQAGKAELSTSLENGQSTLVNEATSHLTGVEQHGKTLVEDCNVQANTAISEVMAVGKQTKQGLRSTIQDSLSDLQGSLQNTFESVQSMIESTQKDFTQEIENSFASIQQTGENLQNALLSGAVNSLQSLQSDLVSSSEKLLQIASANIANLNKLAQTVPPNFTAVSSEVENKINQLIEERLNSIQSLVQNQLSEMKADYQSKANVFINKIKSSQKQLMETVEKSKDILAAEVKDATRKLIVFYNNALSWGIQDGYSDGIMILNAAAETSSDYDSLDSEEVDYYGAHEDFENLENPHENWSCDENLPEVLDLVQDFLSGKKDVRLQDLSCGLEQMVSAGEERLEKIQGKYYRFQISVSGSDSLGGLVSGSLSLSIGENGKMFFSAGTGGNTTPGGKLPSIGFSLLSNDTEEEVTGTSKSWSGSVGGVTVTKSEDGSGKGVGWQLGPGKFVPNVSVMKEETIEVTPSWFKFKNNINNLVDKWKNEDFQDE